MTHFITTVALGVVLSLYIIGCGLESNCTELERAGHPIVASVIRHYFYALFGFWCGVVFQLLIRG